MDTVPIRLPRQATTIRGAGFSLFELILVIVIVAIAAGILLGRILSYQEMAEKTSMEQTAGAIRSALTLQLSGLAARGKMEDIQKLVEINPVVLLTEPPRNYSGEYHGAPDDIQAGNWYFDLKSRQLVYLVRHGTHFQSDQEGPKAVRYQVSLVHNDWMQSAPDTLTAQEVGGITLKEVRPYTWVIK